MSRITRYVIFELLKTFLLTLSAMTLMMVLVFLIQEGVREKLSVTAILELIPYVIPTSLSFAIPGTVLFAASIVYGRMSAKNEIIAIKAMGIPPSRIIVPGLAILPLEPLYGLLERCCRFLGSTRNLSCRTSVISTNDLWDVERSGKFFQRQRLH